MNYIAVTTVHHGRLAKDEDGKNYSKTQVINPGETMPDDLSQKQLIALVRTGAVCAEKDYEKVKKIRAIEAEKFAPRLVDKKDEDAGSYDPQEAARRLEAKNSDSEEEVDETTKAEPKQPATPAEPKGKDPKPTMSKVDLMEIAKERGIEVDETASRDEIYKILKEAK